jgi:zinc D-Ala-D-Ala dipeptidase
MQFYADADALIDDHRVLALPIADNGEPFVDISDLPAMAVDVTRTSVQQMSDDLFHVRAGVADRLARAQACLPSRYQLQLKEGWRPTWVQERLWQLNLDQLRARRPDLADDELHRENARLVAPPDLAPPHSTGGAVDVVLLHQGSYVDMGGEFNQPGEANCTVYPVGVAARRHRDILASAMGTAGFINYPQEWWHWSYGDRYWAFQTTRQAAIYGPR